MFVPSRSTGRLALEVSPWLTIDVLARRSLARQDERPAEPPANGGEGKWTESDVQQACDVLGEQFVGLLAMLTRHQAYRETGARSVIVDARGVFGHEFEKALVEHLQFLEKHPDYAKLMHSLTQDFRDWVARQPPEVLRLGLSDQGSEGVVVTCNVPTPVLEPLPD